MGDTGSLVLGTTIAVITIHFNELQTITNNALHGLPAISLALIIVPVVDTIRVFVIRLSQKRSPFTPDMNHIHHNLLKLTGSHVVTSSIIIAVNGAIILLSFILIDEIGNNVLFILLLVLGFFLASIPGSILKWQKKNVTNEGLTIHLSGYLFKKL